MEERRIPEEAPPAAGDAAYLHLRPHVEQLADLISVTVLKAFRLGVEVERSRHQASMLPPGMRRGPKISLRQIAELVATGFNVSYGQMVGSQRDRAITVPRWAAWWISKQLTAYSASEIGRAYHRDHSTIIHGMRRLEFLMGHNPQLLRQVVGLRDDIGIAAGLITPEPEPGK
jgi:chromosomal replication initiation ATPase DnaA